MESSLASCLIRSVSPTLTTDHQRLRLTTLHLLTTILRNQLRNELPSRNCRSWRQAVKACVLKGILRLLWVPKYCDGQLISVRKQGADESGKRRLVARQRVAS